MAQTERILYMKYLKLLGALVICWMSISVSNEAQGQVAYQPVPLNAPYFTADTQLQGGVKINEFGVAAQVSAHYQGFFGSVMGNFGGAYRLPERGFYALDDDGEYYEISAGYVLKPRDQRLELSMGYGQQIRNDVNRAFAQISWYNESRLIVGGASIRGIMATQDGEQQLYLQPSVQGKLKIQRFRLVGQLGFVISDWEGDYADPLFGLGLEFVLF